MLKSEGELVLVQVKDRFNRTKMEGRVRWNPGVSLDTIMKKRCIRLKIIKEIEVDVVENIVVD